MPEGLVCRAAEAMKGANPQQATGREGPQPPAEQEQRHRKVQECQGEESTLGLGPQQRTAQKSDSSPDGLLKASVQIFHQEPRERGYCFSYSVTTEVSTLTLCTHTQILRIWEGIANFHQSLKQDTK